MNLPPFRELLARPVVRVLCALAAAGVVLLVIHHAGFTAVFEGLGRASVRLPWVVAVEAAMLGCSTLALRSLYGAHRTRLPARGWIKVAMLGYVVGIVAPLGRAAAEAARAVMLSRSMTGPRAAVAALQMNGVALLANAFLSLFAAGGAWLSMGLNRVTWLIIGNSVMAVVISTSILVGRERLRPGRLLGRLARRGHEFGHAFDAAPGASRPFFLRALVWESLARVLQLVQCTIALGAVGAAVTPLSALSIQGVQLVGGSLGDLLPAQLGATEATLVMAAGALSVPAAAAAALALLIHAGQVVWATACAFVGWLIPGNGDVPSGAMEPQS